jgi:hypothetical protein
MEVSPAEYELVTNTIYMVSGCYGRLSGKETFTGHHEEPKYAMHRIQYLLKVERPGVQPNRLIVVKRRGCSVLSGYISCSSSSDSESIWLQ